MSRHGDGATGIAGDIHVVDLVVVQIGRVRHHDQVRAVDLPAHVDLLGDAAEQLLQGLVDGVEGDGADQAGVDVDIQLGVAGQALDDGEFLEIEIVTLGWLVDELRAGRLTDVKTQITTFWLERIFSGAWPWPAFERV